MRPIWAAMAFAKMGDSRRAWELLEMINPLNHTRSPEEIATYKVEPYVVAADVYALSPHIGRGGWTWYTGSAGWMYMLILESLLGLRLEKGQTAYRTVPPCGLGDVQGALPVQGNRLPHHRASTERRQRGECDRRWR